MIRQSPLSWPPGWKRTQSPVWSKFKTSADKATNHMLAEIDRLGGRDVVLSSNAQYRQDGMPYARQGYIGDTGVAVYFTRKGRPVVFACDTYGSIHENIHAIGLTIAALRTIERHGAAELMDRAFTGFEALPAPGASKHWRDVLDVPADSGNTVDQLARAKMHYRAMASARHPDRGGSHEAMTEINRAWEQAQEELKP
jgi:hypothetical protein